MTTVNLTGTDKIDFILNQRSSFNIVLKKFADKLRTEPEDFPIGTWKMSIYTVADEKLILSLVPGNGLSVVGNVLTIFRTTIQNNLYNGTYLYEIKCDLADGTNLLPFVGNLKVEKRLS